MGKFIDAELNLPVIDRRRYNARSISGHASGNKKMISSTRPTSRGEENGSILPR
jgi:hypothetical protein